VGAAAVHGAGPCGLGLWRLFIRDSDTQQVPAAGGGTITMPSGVVLEIPPLALAADTEVSVATRPADQLAVDEADWPRGLHLGSVVLEPDGIALAQPVRLSFPLPDDWDRSEVPVIYEAAGDDPAGAFPGDLDVTIEGAAGALRAVTEIEHFSTYVPSRNCHAGTIRRLLAAYESQGCSREQLVARASTRFDGITIDEAQARYAEPPQVQAFLDTYFDDFASFGAGAEVPPATLAELTGHVLAGRKVVLAFSPGATWPARSTEHAFYPSKPYAHSCVVEPDGQGGARMHHTIVRPRLALDKWRVQALADFLGGELQYTYPFNQLNEYRSAKSGVAFEVAACGTQGCLSEAGLNPWGLDPYLPLDRRKVAYPTVHIYLEKPDVAANPCAERTNEVSFTDPTGDWLITLALPADVAAVADELADPAAYNDQWVEVGLPDFPADPQAWDPLDVSVSVVGGAIDSLRLYPAGNNWDPASRSTTYTEFSSGDSLRLGGTRYYWLYIYTSDPQFSYDYTMQIFRLAGGS
jgi:hypothetical protein